MPPNMGPTQYTWNEKPPTSVSKTRGQKRDVIAPKRAPVVTQWLSSFLRITAGPKERAGLMPHPVKLIWRQQTRLFNKVNILRIHNSEECSVGPILVTMPRHRENILLILSVILHTV